MHALDLGNNGMTEASAASLAAFQDRHPDLRDLNLYMNQIGSAGLKKVPAPTTCTTCHRATDSATCLTLPAGPQETVFAAGNLRDPGPAHTRSAETSRRRHLTSCLCDVLVACRSCASMNDWCVAYADLGSTERQQMLRSIGRGRQQH